MTTDAYYMNIAFAVRKKANCHGRKVGAVLVKNNRIVSTGYNGTPEGMVNCLDGGCLRCANRDREFKSGQAYDACICVHAEQNAVLSAARFGISTEGGTMYTTMQPCFNCSKAMLQAKVARIVFLHPWAPNDKRFHDQYELLHAQFGDDRVRHIKMEDPDAAWANGV